MCGRYEAGQKQKIAEAFRVRVELEDLYSSTPPGFIRRWERRSGSCWPFPNTQNWTLRGNRIERSPSTGRGLNCAATAPEKLG